jgi:hypothetical protein
MANIFLRACVQKGLLEKEEYLLSNLLERGGEPNFNTWEILAEGYIQNRKFEQAVEALNKYALVGKVVPWKPNPVNVLAILKHFENHGDVDSAENLLKLLRDLNYVDTSEMFIHADIKWIPCSCRFNKVYMKVQVMKVF